MTDTESNTIDTRKMLMERVIEKSRQRLRGEGVSPCTELVIAGPSCSGKTRFAAYASGMLRYHFVEGDLFHLQHVMERARTEHIPMTDEYRENEWFHALSGGLMFAALQNIEIVLTCSALRRSFRDRLIELGEKIGMGDLWIVWLDVPPDVLRERARKRQEETNHPFGPEMIDSQLAAAEVCTAEERHVIAVDGTLDQPQLLRQIVEKIPGLPEPVT